MRVGSALMLSISLLGSQAVVDATSGRIRTRSSRTIALLALLVARTDRPQDRAAIAGLFWPDSGDSQALTNLRRELHDLRDVLGKDDDSLEVTQIQLCWHDRGVHDVDLATFLREADAATAADEAGDERAVIAHGQAALEPYGGPLLPGLDEEWLVELRDELEACCSAVCDLVCRAARASGRSDVAMSAMRRKLSIERYDETAYRTLMELLAESGDRAGAVSTYHQLASLLERDLGITPAPETTATLSQLMGSTSTPDTPLRQASARPPARAALVGRADELDQLSGAWDLACTGRAGIVIVRGGPGVGKTRLVTELETMARGQNAVVGITRCFDTSGRLSLAPVADWLRDPALISARSLIDQVWREEADRLVPVGSRSTPEGPALGAVPPPGGPDVWQRPRFFEGLARALLARSQPVLLVLDNAQWSDPDTLSFVRFLLNFAPDAPLLLVATARPSDTAEESALDAWLAHLRDEGLLTEVNLLPLDVAGTATLAGELTGQRPEGTAADLLFDATGGFPLYVVEAARSSTHDLSGQGPSSPLAWMDILPRRIQQTSPAAREVAGLAAAVGRDFTIPLLVEASELPAEGVVTAVDELWRQRIIRGVGDSYDFSHDLLREAAYDSVREPRRWLLHRRLGQALELLWAGNLDGVAAQVAEQYRRAGNPERALRYYRQGADVAGAMFAHEEAVALLASARDVLASMPPGRSRDEQELALLELAVPPLNARYGYSSPLVREALERALELADNLGEEGRALTAMVGLWASRFVEGRIEDSRRIAEQAVARVSPGDEQFGQAHFSLGGSSLHVGSPERAVEHFQIAGSVPEDEQLSVGTHARVHVMAWWAHAAWTCGDEARAAELATDASTAAQQIGHRYSLVVAQAYEAITRQLLGDIKGCLEAATSVRALCERYQFTYYGDWGRILEGWATGGSAGVDLIEAGMGNLRAAGAYARMPYWLSLLGQTLDDDHRPIEAMTALDAGLAAAEQQGEPWWTPELLRLRAGHLAGAEREQLLTRGLETARGQHSAVLERRCRDDLHADGARRSPNVARQD